MYLNNCFSVFRYSIPWKCTIKVFMVILTGAPKARGPPVTWHPDTRPLRHCWWCQWYSWVCFVLAFMTFRKYWSKVGLQMLPKKPILNVWTLKSCAPALVNCISEARGRLKRIKKCVPKIAGKCWCALKSCARRTWNVILIILFWITEAWRKWRSSTDCLKLSLLVFNGTWLCLTYDSLVCFWFKDILVIQAGWDVQQYLEILRIGSSHRRRYRILNINR